MFRKAAVAGSFYPGTPEGLRRQIESMLDTTAQAQDCLALMLPHAGYIYSGKVAARTLAQAKIKEVALVLGPNHTGLGSPFSLMRSGSWKTPLGEVPLEEELAQRLEKESTLIREDETAHVYEHSIEVELPLLQYFCPSLSFVPIVVADFHPERLRLVGETIGRVIKTYARPVLLVASSDMTHYESADAAREKDEAAITAIQDLDPEKLLLEVRRRKISMCGVAPVAVMLHACRILGAKSARLVVYQNSGDVSGDYSSVVGYAGMIVQ